MNSLRTQALKLRLQGLSYNEINNALGIPKSTLSGWCKDMVLSDTARARLEARVQMGTQNGLVRRNKLQTHYARKRSKETQQIAKKEIRSLSKHELKLIGIALYWAEGYKRLKRRNGIERTWHTISFVNSDPQMTHLFIRFLMEVMDVPTQEIRLTMRLYPHINERKARDFWMRATALPANRFYKTQYLISGASRSIRPHNRLAWGTLQIEVCRSQQFHRLVGWIEGMKENG